MGKRNGLTDDEKENVTRSLAANETTLEIANKLNRDHRTIKRFVSNCCKQRTRSDKGKLRTINRRQLTALKRTASSHPLSNSKSIFSEAGLNVQSKSTRCRILRKIAKVKKATKQPPLKKIHKEKRVEWAKRYMKLDFRRVVFTDECRATLDGPDGWARGWLTTGTSTPVRFRRQQGGGGVMFWAGIHGKNLIGPFKIDEGVKLDSASYSKLLEDRFMPYVNSMPRQTRNQIILMHDNAPSHASRFTQRFLADNGFTGSRLMIWPSSSPDLNPIENYWAIFKLKLYEGGRQFSNNDDLWRTITETFASMDRTHIEILTSSMDNRVAEVLKRTGNYIYH